MEGKVHEGGAWRDLKAGTKGLSDLAAASIPMPEVDFRSLSAVETNWISSPTAATNP
jgi:hypothetical protein